MTRTCTHRFSPPEAYRAFMQTGTALPDDLLALPSIEIEQWKTLPETSGVYFFLLSGADIRNVQKTLRHNSLQTTEIYLNETLRLSDAAERVISYGDDE